MNSDLNSLHEPFILDVDDDGMLGEIDPDQNIFSGCPMAESRYYVESEFNNMAHPYIYSDHNPFIASLLHLNMRSLPHNFDRLTQYLDCLNIKFPIIGVTETWHNESTIDLYEMEGYFSEHVYRANRRGGGATLYISDFLQYKRRHDLSFQSEQYEGLFIEVTGLHHRKHIVGLIYRPPCTDLVQFNLELDAILSKIKLENSICYLMGDFNVNIINFENHDATSDFLNTMFSYSFFPLINKPTRITSTSSTLIDNIFCNKVPDCDNAVGGLLITDLSDHLPIFYILPPDDNMQVSQNKDCFQRNLSNSRKAEFKTVITEIDFDTILGNGNVQMAFTEFHTKIKTAYEDAFPLRKITKQQQNKPWLTTGLKRCIKVKNKLFKRFKRYPSLYNERRYKTYKKMLHNVLNHAEREHYDCLFKEHSNNPQKSWNIIKRLIGLKKKIINAEFEFDGELKADKSEISNKFNNFFTEVGLKLNENIKYNGNYNIDDFLPSPNCHTMHVEESTPAEIEEIIRGLKNSAAGWDDIKPVILKTVSDCLAYPLSVLFNKSICEGSFPSELKIAKVVPIFKGGDPKCFSNYRPISVLSAFSKIFERLMYNRMINFINKFQILSPYQFGFRKGFSADSALALLVDNITKALDKGDYFIGLFIDLSKAFDTVAHDILLHKLKHYGLRGVIFDWLKSYIMNRKQFVVYNETPSAMDYIRCGVPQGSILGPLLFLLYVNDLPFVSRQLNTIMFADDTNLFLQDHDLVQLQNRFNEELKKVSSWIKLNKLSLNISKTHCLLFTRKKQSDLQIELKIDDTPVQLSNRTKFLGVILSDDLSWKYHVEKICQKIARGIGLLKKMRYKLCDSTLLMLYYSYIYPYLHYCNIVWGRAPKVYINRLFVLQKIIIRMIGRLGYRESTAENFKNMNILTINQLSIFNVCVFMRKIAMNVMPEVLSQKFAYRRDVHLHSTRSTCLFNLPLCKTETSKKSISFAGPYYFNQLLKSPLFRDLASQSMSIFRRNVRTLLNSNYFESMTATCI